MKYITQILEWIRCVRIVRQLEQVLEHVVQEAEGEKTSIWNHGVSTKESNTHKKQILIY